MAESPLDSCANCWHRDYHHRGSCTGAGLHLRWARFLQVRCQCERFVSARAIIADLQRQLQQAQETLSHVNEAYDIVKAERDATAEAVIEHLREMVHDAFEDNAPPSKQWLDEFCSQPAPAEVQEEAPDD